MICALFAAVLVGFASAACAQPYGNPPEGSNPQGQEMRQQMRQEMIAACQGQSEGAACSISRGDRTISGVCQQNRRGELVCRMAGHHRGGGGMGGAGGGMGNPIGGGMGGPNGGGMGGPNGGGMPPDNGSPEQ
jgi:hypothetical protein